MRGIYTFSVKLVLMVALLLSFPLAKAQLRYMPLSTENFTISVKNLAKTASNKLEFDVFLLDTDASVPFELGNCQLGFLLNSNIFAGGTISVNISNAGSGLNDNQKFITPPRFTSSVPGYPGQTLIRLAGRTSPATGNGTIISTVGQGTFLTHFTITNSVNFKINSTPNLSFISNSEVNPLYATRVTEYINNYNTPLAIIPGTNALVSGNPVLTDDFMLSVKNLKQTAPAKLEFDVSLFDTDSDLPFELGSCQLSFLFNSLIYTGGTISVAISNTGSGLNTAQQFTAVPSIINSIPGIPNQTLIKLAGRTTPGDGNGTPISMTNPETLLTHFIITSSVNFTENSTPNLTFISSRAVNPLYASRISEYIDHINTPLTVVPDTNAIVTGNPVLNATFSAPIAYEVTAGGSYCQIIGGIPVGLTNSEQGVDYTLYKDGVAQLPTIPGTGTAISFGKQLFGTYTISGTRGSDTIIMTGSAVIIENPALAASITIAPDDNNVCPGASVTFTATGVNKGTNPVYQWKVNGINVGLNNEIYIYNPGNNDAITCILTSDAECTPDPVSSNVVIMTIASPMVGGTITGNSTTIYGNSTDVMTLGGYVGAVVKWQKMQGLGSWTDIANSTYTFSEIPTSAGIWKYRAQLQSGICSAVFSAPISISVLPKTLTIAGTFTSENKEYDGTVAATIASDGLNLVTKLGNDDVNLVPVAAFADQTVGTAKIVSLTGSSLAGADAGNYTLSLDDAPVTTADIVPATLTLGVFPDMNKIYEDPDFVIVGPASISTGAFNYTSSNTSVATISGNTVTIVSAGTAIITAVQQAFGNYSGASATALLTVAKANQVLTLLPLPTPLPLNQFIGTPLMIQGSSSSGLNTTLALGSGSPATLSYANGHYYLSTTLAVGIVEIIVNQAGNDNYNPAQIIQSFDVTRGNQIITFDALAPLTYATGLSIDLTAVASSGLPVSFAVLSGPGSISYGNHLIITGAGTVIIEASQEGNSDWNPATKVNNELTINKATPVITNFTDIIKTYGDPSFMLVPSSNSTGAFSFTSSNTSIATISGNIVNITGAGITTITVTQGASSDYTSVFAQVSLTVLKADQTITFNPLSDKKLGEPAFDLTATSTSLLGISFTSSNTLVGIVNGKTVTISGLGITTITARQGGDTNFNPAPDVSRSFTVNPCTNPTSGGNIIGDQDLCELFDPLPINSLSAPTGQPGTLEYKWQESIKGSNTGFEDIAASNSETYDPGMLTQTTWFKRISRAICNNDWTGAVESNVVMMTVNPRTVGGTITGAGSVIYGNSTGMMILDGYVGTVVKWQKTDGLSSWTDIVNNAYTYSESPTSAGTWKYRAQLQNGNCSVVYSAPFSIIVLPRTLTIGGTFTSGNKEYDGSIVAAITLDGLTLVNKVGNDVVSLVSVAVFADKKVGTAKTVSLTGTTLTGADAGNYILSLTGAPFASADITPIPVTLGAFPDIHKTYGDPDFVLISPASVSSGAFSYTSSDLSVATISGNTVTIVGAGTATITAIQEAADGYASATATAMLTIAKANQILTLYPVPTLLPLNQFIGTPLMIQASSSSGLDVTLTLGPGSPATLSFSDGSYSFTTTLAIGIVVIIVDQPGDANYNPAQIIQSFDVTKGNQIITFNALAPLTYAPVLSIDLTAVASSELPVSYSVMSGPASISNGNHLTITGAGTVVIRSSQAGNSSWNPATNVYRNLIINKATPVITNFNNIIKTYGDPSFLLNPSSNSAGVFSFTSSNTNIATISGNTVNITGAGNTTITVMQDASSDYTSVNFQVSLTVLKANQIITFNALSDKNLGDPDFNLTATSTSLLGITFTNSNAAVATINGKTVTIKGLGTTTVTASQAGDSNFNAAPDVRQLLNVNSCMNPLNGGTIDGDQDLCGIFDPLQINSITRPIGQHGILEYKWQESTTSSSTGFEDIESSNSETYDPKLLKQTTWFKRIARVNCKNDWAGAVESNVVKITTYPRTIGGKITGIGSVIYGSTTGEMILSEYVGTVVKWQKMRVSGTIPDVWTDINTIASTYSEIPRSAGTWKYRALIQSGNCSSLVSASLTITVLPKTLTIGGTFTSANKEYDGTVAAIIISSRLTLVTKVGNDNVNLIAVAAFADKAVGVAKTVSLTGASLTGADAGNYILSFNSAPTAKADITPIPVTLGVFPDIIKTYGDPDFVLVKPASSSYGAFSFTSSDTTVAKISGKNVTIIGAGIAIITATQEAFESYASASVTAQLTVKKADQVITTNPLPSPLPLNQFVGTPVLIGAGSSSGLEVKISLGPDSPASLSFANGHYYLTATLSAGIVEIIFDQPGNANYNPARITQKFDVTLGNQIITFNALTPLTYIPGLSIDLTAVASSGLPVSYAVMNGPASISNGNHLNITGAGTVIIQASQAGNSSWNPATNVTRYLIINKATPVIINFADIIKTYGDPSFPLTAFSNSPGAFSYTSSNTNVATISGNRVNITGAGITTITVNQDPGLDYTSATAQITLFVIKADQTITFKPLKDKNLGDPAFELTATTSSLLEISYTSSNTSVATVNGKTVTIKGAGTTTITASQQGNSNYNAASSVYQPFRVNSFVNPISSVQNLIQTAPNKLEFDVYLMDINSSEPFELGTSQFGFLINSLIYSGGKLSVAISNTGSGLNAEQQFTATPVIVSSLPGNPDQTLIKLAGRTAPGSGNGSLILNCTPGTLLTHFILTSTVDFTANSTPNLCYISNSVYNPLYPTRLSKYIKNRDTPLTVIPGINAIVNGNPFLNPTSCFYPPVIVSIVQPTCLVATGSVTLKNLPSDNWSITIFPGNEVRSGIGTSAVIDGLIAGITPVTYTVKVTDSNGCTSPASGNIVINPIEGKPFSPTIIKQDNTLISSSDIGNQWYVDGQAIQGATEKQYTVVSLGTYYVIVTRNSCSSELSNWIMVSNLKPPSGLSAPVIVSVLQPTCSTVTGSVSLNNLPPGNWIITILPGGEKRSGKGISTIIDGLIVGTTSVSYTVKVTDSEGWTSPASGNIVINPIEGKPLSPTIIMQDSTLISSSDVGNQWYVDGKAIQGATGKHYTLVSLGTYYVIVTLDNCSSALSNRILVYNLKPPSGLSAPVIVSVLQPTCSTVTGSVSLNNLPPGNWSITILPGGEKRSGKGTSTIIEGLIAGTTSVSYTVKVTDSEGRTSPASGSIVINPIQTKPLSPTIIKQDSTLISSSDSGNQWYVDGKAIQGATGKQYTVASLGTYYVIVNRDSCSSEFSNWILVSNLKPPSGFSAPSIVSVFQPTCSIVTGSVSLNNLPPGNWNITILPGGEKRSGKGISTIIEGLIVGTTSVSYTVKVTDSEGWTSPASGNIVINPIQEKPLSPTIIKQGNNLISSSDSGNQWYVDGKAIQGATEKQYTVVSPGTYYVIVTRDVCSSDFSNWISVVTLNPTLCLAAPNIVSIIQPTCSVVTGSVLLNNLPSGNWNITILPGGENRNGKGTSAVIDGLTAGTTSSTFTVSVADSYGCFSPSSADIVINPIPEKPLAPTIIKRANTLISSSDIGNQWYLDGLAITGATGKQFTAISLGSYYSIVTREGCTSGYSNWIPFEEVNTTYEVYPNPSNGIFNLKIETAKTELFNLRIYNIPGQVFWEMNNVSVNGLFKLVINLSESPSGVYILTINNKDTNIVKKIIVRH